MRVLARCVLFVLPALAALECALAQSPEFIASQVTSGDYSNYLSSLPVQRGKSRGYYYDDPVYGYSAQPDLLVKDQANNMAFCASCHKNLGGQ